MNIGNKIRELRKRRGITQEQLAECIGVSFQAVSKWENNIALPDITMAPVLATYFGVSMDVLFDFNLKDIEAAVEAIVDEAVPYRESDPKKYCAIIRAGLETYPDNDILLNNLLYGLNYSENPDETLAIAGRLVANTVYDDVRYDALRFMAYAYKAKGDMASAKAAIEQIPEIYFTKLTEAAFLLSGQEKLEAAEKQKWISYENLLQMMWKMAECFEESGETKKAIRETEKAMALIALEDCACFDNYKDFFTTQLNRMKGNA